MSKQREALKLAQAFIRWTQFGECRTEHHEGPIATAAQVDAAIREALAEPFDPVQDAAHDLLEALEEMMNRAHPAYVGNDFMRGKLIATREIARATIAKAKGEV